MQSDWHLQFLSNASFYAAYPQLKMIQLFEHAKVEDLEGMCVRCSVATVLM